MIELAYLGFFALAAFGIGSLALNYFKARFHSFAEEFFFSVGIGYGLIALMAYPLGFLGLLYKQVFLLIFLSFAILSHKRIVYLLKKVFYFSRTRVRPDAFSVLLLVAAFFAFFNLIASLAPPWSYDATVYHLAVPKIYAAEHGFVALPSLLQSNWVMIPHMLFLAATLIKNSVLANLVNFSFGLFLAVGIFSFGSRFFGRNVGMLAASIFLTLPIIIVHSVSAHADLPLAFFAFLSFYAFMLWSAQERASPVFWLAISAIAAGLAASSKMTGLAIIPIMGLLVFSRILFLNKASFRISSLFIPVIFGVIAVAAASPAYIKNLVYSGNPFFPLFYDVFGGKFLNSTVSSYFFIETDYGTGRGLLSFLLLPWNMTMDPLKFVELLGIGPLFLAFVPLVIFVKKNRALIFTLAAGLLCLVAWFLASQALRYVIYALPLFSIIAACVIFSLSAVQGFSGKALRYFIAVVIAAVLIFNTALLFGANAKQVPAALGVIPEEVFYERLNDGNIYGVCRFANSNLPANAKILLLYENRGYHCDIPYILGDPREQAYIDYSAISTAGAYAARLKEIGVTHILVNRASPIFKPDSVAYPHEASMLIDGLIGKYGVSVYSEGGRDLYLFNYNKSASSSAS